MTSPVGLADRRGLQHGGCLVWILSTTNSACLQPAVRETPSAGRAGVKAATVTEARKRKKEKVLERKRKETK